MLKFSNSFASIFSEEYESCRKVLDTIIVSFVLMDFQYCKDKVLYFKEIVNQNIKNQIALQLKIRTTNCRGNLYFII